MKRSTIIVFFLLFLFFLDSVYCQREYRSHVQELQRWFHPSLTFQTEYDDNVFLQPTDEEDDFIFTLTPGIFVNVPFAGDSHLFTLDYYADLAAFADFDDQNYDNHYLLGNLDFNFPNFYVKTYDDFRSTSVRAATEFTDRIERFENLYSFDIGSEEWNKISLEGGYDFFLTSYREDKFEQFDHEDHTFNGTFFYRLFPKSKALLEYNHALISYDEAVSRDGDFDQIRLGLTGEILTKLVGTVKAGYQDRRYDDSDQDWSSAVFYSSLVQNFSAHTTVSLIFERNARESVYGVNNFYTTNIFSAVLNQQLFFERLDGRLGFTYQMNDYPETTTEAGLTQEREDDLYDLELGIDYTIRDWLLTGTEYHYTRRGSNFGIFDYDDNRIVWKISALF